MPDLTVPLFAGLSHAGEFGAVAALLCVRPEMGNAVGSVSAVNQRNRPALACRFGAHSSWVLSEAEYRPKPKPRVKEDNGPEGYS